MAVTHYFVVEDCNMLQTSIDVLQRIFLQNFGSDFPEILEELFPFNYW